MTARVAALTVTYGDRWRYLSTVLQRLREESSVVRVLVIDNGSRVSIAQRVSEAGYGDFVRVLQARTNEGPAVAYARGLTYLRGLPEVTHVYLLDDDNLPEAGAVDLLARMAEGTDPSIAFMSLRPSQTEHMALLRDGVPIAMRHDSFLGYSLSAALRRRWPLNRLRRPDKREGPSLDIEYAPYGGFFFAVSQLDVVGLPRQEFVLYVDDHEFTHRFVRAGGSIRLCMQSRLVDLEPSWHTPSGQPIPPLFDPASPDFRVYYTVRNRVVFEREHLIRSRAAYVANAAATLLHGASKAARGGVTIGQLLGRSALIGSAIADGWRGALGHNPRVPLPGSARLPGDGYRDVQVHG